MDSLSECVLLTRQRSQCLRPKGMAKPSLPLASVQMLTVCADSIPHSFLLPEIYSLRLLPCTENPQPRLAKSAPLFSYKQQIRLLDSDVLSLGAAGGGLHQST